MPTLQANLCWESTPRMKVSGGVWGVDACLGWEAFEWMLGTATKGCFLVLLESKIPFLLYC